MVDSATTRRPGLSPALSRGRVAAFIAVCVAMLLSGRTAGSQSIWCEALGEGVACSVDTTSLFTPLVRGRFDSGFTNHLLYRVYVYPEGEDDPVSVAVAAFAQVFRLYSDVYYLSRQGVDGYEAYESWEEVVGALGRFSVVVASSGDLPAGRYLAVAFLEVNPVSEAHLSQAQRWIAGARGEYQVFADEGPSEIEDFALLFTRPTEGQAEVSSRFESEPFLVEVP